MGNNGLNKLITYWKQIYESQDPINSAYKGLPVSIRDKFEKDYLPQPFYGYFNQDMSDDILVPLINPGPIRSNEISILFPSNSYEASTLLWNEDIKQRYLNLPSKDLFHERERDFELKLGKNNWRGQKLNQCKRIVGEDIEFMLTIEYFPFHSHTFNVKNKIKEQWLDEIPSTILSIQAIEEISINRLVKHIIGIGKPWADILTKYPEKFSLELYTELRGPKRSQKFYKFKPIHSPNALPIVIYSGFSMDLPASTAGIKILQELLELS